MPEQFESTNKTEKMDWKFFFFTDDIKTAPEWVGERPTEDRIDFSVEEV